MREEAPGSGVPLRRKQVAPVLANKPRSKEARDFGAMRQPPEFGDPADQEQCKHGEPKCELVNTESAQIDPRA